ncbi:MAG: zinc-containing alcohol dehydrogenase, partial [Conexibacter sp.]|nr:zinc-containing alcohol dehydrogenase [Conexibacter sp.]
MLQLTYRGRGDLAVEDVASSEPGPGEVRVRVHSTGLCTSDVYGYAGVNDRRDAVLGPGDVLVMGHESSGHVDAVGAGVAGLALGDPVAIDPVVGCGDCAHCRAGDANLCEERRVHGCTPAAPGGFAELVTVPRGAVHALPDGASLELGALVEPLTVGFHGVRLAAPRMEDRVLVIGGGIIGIGAALAARRRVGDRVLVLEP